MVKKNKIAKLATSQCGSPNPAWARTKYIRWNRRGEHSAPNPQFSREAKCLWRGAKAATSVPKVHALSTFAVAVVKYLARSIYVVCL